MSLNRQNEGFVAASSKYIPTTHHAQPNGQKLSKNAKRRLKKKQRQSERGFDTGHVTMKWAFDWSWLWKYLPLAIMFIAISVSWIRATPEGHLIEETIHKNIDEMKMELEAWIDTQIAVYEETLKLRKEQAQALLFPKDMDASSEIGWLLDSEEHRYTKNRTAQFFDYYASSIATVDLIPRHLKHDIFVYIPGLFTQWYPGYMNDLIKGMNAMGFDTFMCPINTAGSQKENAIVVADAIIKLTEENPGRKIVILGHSKGALDAATAFVLRPEIIPHVSAFIAFQAPWGGSAIANDLLNGYNRKLVSSVFIEKILNGNPHSLVGVMYSERRKWLEAHPFPLGAVPTISVATYETAFKSLLKAPIDYVNFRYNELSDGCVALKDAIIPGTILVEISGIDHFGPAYHGFPACCSKVDPVRAQATLLSVLFHAS